MGNTSPLADLPRPFDINLRINALTQEIKLLRRLRRVAEDAKDQPGIVSQPAPPGESVVLPLRPEKHA